MRENGGIRSLCRKSPALVIRQPRKGRPVESRAFTHALPTPVVGTTGTVETAQLRGAVVRVSLDCRRFAAKALADLCGILNLHACAL